MSQDELLDCTEDIMEAIDVDGDGDITQVEEISSANNLMQIILGRIHRTCLQESVHGKYAKRRKLVNSRLCNHDINRNIFRLFQ